MSHEMNMEIAKKLVEKIPANFDMGRFMALVDELMVMISQLCSESVMTFDELIQLTKIRGRE